MRRATTELRISPELQRQYLTPRMVDRTRNMLPMSLHYRPITGATPHKPQELWAVVQLLESLDQVVQAMIVECRRWMRTKREGRRTLMYNMTPIRMLKCTVEAMCTPILSKPNTRANGVIEFWGFGWTKRWKKTDDTQVIGTTPINSTY